MGADQPFTADRVQHLGVGCVLDSQTADSTVIRERVAALRDDAKMRDRVKALRTETLALPDPTAVVRKVETLVASAR